MHIRQEFIRNVLITSYVDGSLIVYSTHNYRHSKHFKFPAFLHALANVFAVSTKEDNVTVWRANIIAVLTVRMLRAINVQTRGYTYGVVTSTWRLVTRWKNYFSA